MAKNANAKMRNGKAKNSPTIGSTSDPTKAIGIAKNSRIKPTVRLEILSFVQSFLFIVYLLMEYNCHFSASISVAHDLN